MNLETTPWVLLLALTLPPACQSQDAPPSTPKADFSEGTDVLPPIEESPSDFSTWGTERIPLPPGFAPTLPPGDELLLFAPGMFDPEAEDFWSYVFLIELEEPLTDIGHVQSFLELYYDGLITAVGSGDGKTPPETPATVFAISSYESLDHAVYELEIDLIDTFVTQEPLHLYMSVIEESPTRFRFQASPQARTHAVWQTLTAAAATLEL